jgi:uncharacterized protein (DUF1330 family)
MSAILITIGTLNPDGGHALDRYAEGVIPLIQAAGGAVVSRAQPTECVVGSADGMPDLVAVMRFPSAEGIRSFLSSDAYRSNLPHRNRAFSLIHSYIATDMLGGDA